MNHFNQSQSSSKSSSDDEVPGTPPLAQQRNPHEYDFEEDHFCDAPPHEQPPNFLTPDQRFIGSIDLPATAILDPLTQSMNTPERQNSFQENQDFALKDFEDEEENFNDSPSPFVCDPNDIEENDDENVRNVLTRTPSPPSRGNDVGSVPLQNNGHEGTEESTKIHENIEPSSLHPQPIPTAIPNPSISVDRLMGKRIPKNTKRSTDTALNAFFRFISTQETLRNVKFKNIEEVFFFFLEVRKIQVRIFFLFLDILFVSSSSTTNQ